MKRILIRHAITDGNRANRLAYGKEGASINEQGKLQAYKLGIRLKELDINLESQLITVSELIRTYQTAETAGPNRIIVNPLFNEVNTSNPSQTDLLISNGQLPAEARKAARKILDNPPDAEIIVTHGLLIAALALELNQIHKDALIPNFCEIWEMNF